MTLDEVLAKLDRPKGNGKQYTARCPAHPDRKPSLSISVGDDDRVLLHCHADCSVESICAAIGITTADLFTRTNGNGAECKVLHEYDYTNADGEVLFRIVRYVPKDFRPFYPDGNGGWIKGANGHNVLYNLPSVAQAVAKKETIYICEGEKDADILDRKAGVVATTAPFGAKSEWKDQHTEALRGADRVVIIADNDDAGRKHAFDVAAHLRPVVWDLRIVQAKTGKDAFDHLIAGHGIGDFVPIEVDDPAPAREDVDPSWERVDLHDMLNGEIEIVTATILQRDDGKSLFYAGRVNSVHADSGAGKTMIAVEAAAQETNAAHHVMWLDFEEPNALVLIERLRQLGVQDEDIETCLHYRTPTTECTDSAIDMLIAECNEHGITLVVLDSLGEAFGLDAIDENSDFQVAPWLRRVVRRIADAGPAVLMIDHSTKASDSPLHPSGSKRKRAAINGHSCLVDVVKPFTRESGGRVKLICAKDRHGHYRRGDIVATFDMMVYPDGRVSMKVWRPFPSEVGPNKPDAKLRLVARSAVKATKDAGHPLSQRQLVALMSVKASAETKRAGIETAIADGAIQQTEGARKAVLHVYVHDLSEPGSDNRV